MMTSYLDISLAVQFLAFGPWYTRVLNTPDFTYTNKIVKIWIALVKEKSRFFTLIPPLAVLGAWDKGCNDMILCV